MYFRDPAKLTRALVYVRGPAKLTLVYFRDPANLKVFLEHTRIMLHAAALIWSAVLQMMKGKRLMVSRTARRTNQPIKGSQML